MSSQSMATSLCGHEIFAEPEDLFANVVVSGEATMFASFAQRMTRRLPL